MSTGIEVGSILSISDLGELVKAALANSFGSEGIWVKGVVASYSANSSGHHYLDLQEFSELGSTSPIATIGCVMWKMRAPIIIGRLHISQLGPIRNGLSLVVRVKPNYWVKGGRLSFQIEDIDIELSQIANLQEKEKIRQKLKLAGIWDNNLNLLVPEVPLSVGLVTAQGSAAESDFLEELSRAKLGFRVQYVPASTAGDAAPTQIAQSISKLQSSRVDLICLVRGGGSMSDLSVFDSELVVGAVAASKIPVWVGVGHSTDTTLVEEVANRHFDVPQSVARAVVFKVQEFIGELGDLSRKILQIASSRTEVANSNLTEMSNLLLRDPSELLRRQSLLIATLTERVSHLGQLSITKSDAVLGGIIASVASTAGRDCDIQSRSIEKCLESLADLQSAAIQSSKHSLDLYSIMLTASDPEQMAAKGFALLATESGVLIKSIDSMNEGDLVKGRLGRGSFVARVNEVNPNVNGK